MFFDRILYGIQYYRAPTPLPDEWEYDLGHMFDWLSVDTIQLRIQWRQNEPREGEYRFDDIDRLFAVAEANGLKVIVKFLLENAPQYVYDKYGGYRVDASGGIIRSGSHGAYYVGGWLPCFSHPDVRAAARRFVETIAARYAGRPSLILWNAWNEPRNRPVGECYCPHCRAAYARWLREKYGTVDNLNRTFGLAEDSFDTIQLPAMSQGYWDIFLFKKWKSGRYLYDAVKLVADGIRRCDTSRPIMTHTGCHSGHQMLLNDLCDDFEVKKAVDFYGTSFGCEPDMDSHGNRLFAQFTADFMRCVDRNFFAHEIYPGLGMFSAYDKPEDMTFKLWSILSAGAKGLVFWQYRAERLGCENDCAGIVGMDGEKRPVTASVKAFGDILHADETLFARLAPVRGDAAILFDYDSMLISAIEDGSETLFDLGQRPDALAYYTKAHRGVYRLLRDLDLNVEYVTADALRDGVPYKVLYLSDYELTDESLEETLYEFVYNGGVLIADEGFGLRRRDNLWLRTGRLPYGKLIDAKLRQRRRCDDTLELGGETVRVTPYRSWYDTAAEPIVRFRDGGGAAYEFSVGKGKVLLLAASAGYAYELGADGGWRTFIGNYLADRTDVRKQKYGDTRHGLYHRSMRGDGVAAEVLLNWTGRTVGIDLPASARVLTGQTVSRGRVALADRQVLCFACPVHKKM